MEYYLKVELYTWIQRTQNMYHAGDTGNVFREAPGFSVLRIVFHLKHKFCNFIDIQLLDFPVKTFAIITSFLKDRK